MSTCEYEIKYLKPHVQQPASKERLRKKLILALGIFSSLNSMGTIIDMTDDHQRILAVFESSCAAWNRGDIDGYLAAYWNSDKVRWVSEGTVRYGFEAIAAGLKARFDTPDNMGRLEVTNLDIQLPGENDALVFGAWILTTPVARRHGVFTVHLKKIDGDWMIVSDHSSTSG